jgi:hypothetical protein
MLQSFMLRYRGPIQLIARWNGKVQLSDWAKKPVRLRFKLPSIRVYAFQFCGLINDTGRIKTFYWFVRHDRRWVLLDSCRFE